MSFENNPLHVNQNEHRFEIEIDDQKAFINYKKSGNKIYLIHTEVPPEIEGKGVASALVEKTLIYLQENNLQLVPMCSYVQRYLQKHPNWNTLLAAEAE